MRDIYEAIGELARVAHANGDHIDENTYPTDDDNDAHGLDVFHRGHYYRIRAVPNEPRFTIGSPFVLVSQLRDQYTPEQISERADVDFATLPSDEQEAVINTLLHSDLETAETHEEQFKARFEDEITPTQFEVLRLTFGQNNLWNGLLVQDRIFPHHDAFGIETYRSVIEDIRTTKVAIGELLSETIPPLQDDYVEETVDPEREKSEGMDAFY